MNRRDFIRLGSIAGPGSLILESCAPAAKEALPLLVTDEPFIPGEERWQATTCLLCAAGCGIQVRQINGNVVKVEGNEKHPVNRGKSCARGQAALQTLYNPDRIRHPLRRVGERGEDKWQAISWDEALGELAAEMAELPGSARDETVTILSSPLNGSMEVLVRHFMNVFGISNLLYQESFSEENARQANLYSFGMPQQPTYDFSQTDYILSVGAPFLETWNSPVHYTRALAEMRHGRPGHRGKFVHVDPRLSLTAAAADEWIPIRPGTEVVFLLALAHILIRTQAYDERFVSRSTVGFEELRDFTGHKKRGFRQLVLDRYEPERVASLCSVSPEKIRRLAEELGRQPRAVVLGGGSAAGGPFGYGAMWAANCLNLLLGNYEKPGGWSFDPRPPLSPIKAPVAAPEEQPGSNLTPLSNHGGGPDLGSRTPRTTDGRFPARALPASGKLVILYNSNPVYESPAFLNFEDRLKKFSKIVAIVPYANESSLQADLILPASTFLESWQDDIPDSGAGRATWSLVQPVHAPLHDSRSFGDILLGIGRRSGGNRDAHFPWQSFEGFIKARSRGLFESARGSVVADDFEQFWDQVRTAGGWWDVDASPRTGSSPSNRRMYFFRGSKLPDPLGKGLSDPLIVLEENSRSRGEENSKYPFHFCPYASLYFGAGEGANLPLLQETPDPMIRSMWGNHLEISPEAAANLRLKEDDPVWVESAHGRIRARVRLFPGLDGDVVAMAAGQGHTHYGRYAQDRGANPSKVLSPVYDSQTEVMAWAATRVRVERIES